jgi:uncharacterized protein (DUF433 family)
MAVERDRQMTDDPSRLTAGPATYPCARSMWQNAESFQEARRRIDMTTTDRVEINPRVMLGKPVIRGTRIPVELLLRKLSEGASESELVDAYPRLTREDIQAAIRYAADTLAHEEVIFVHATQDDSRG